MKHFTVFLLIFLFWFQSFVFAEKTKWLSDKYAVNPNFFFKEYRLEKSDKIMRYKQILKRKIQQKNYNFHTLPAEKIKSLQSKLDTIKMRTVKNTSLNESKKDIRLSLVLWLEDILELAQKGTSSKIPQSIDL